MTNSTNLSLGLIGYPLDHSLSPVLHNAALQTVGIEGKYELYPISKALYRQDGLRKMIDAMRSGKIHGLNITRPYKQNILAFADVCSRAVNQIGAANVLYIHNGKIVADNTDATGFLVDLQNLYSTHSRTLDGEHCALVLGAGGAARAVVMSLLSIGWSIIIASRNLIQACELCTNFASNKIYSIPMTSNAIRALSSIDLIINATPVGTHPQNTASPWFENMSLPDHAVVYDLVYNPVNSLFVRTAHSLGHIASGGIGMLIEQAALSFEIWAGIKAPREAMRGAIIPYLSW